MSQSGIRAHNAVDTLVDVIRHTYDVLDVETDFTPHNLRITELRTNLIRHLQDAARHLSPAEQESVAAHESITPVVLELRRLLGVVEASMEQYWAKRLSMRDRVADVDLDQFWYLDMYETLVYSERRAILQLAAPKPSRIAIAGSGALPMTGVMLARSFGASALCIDYDGTSNELAREWVERLETPVSMDFVTTDAADADYLGVDLLLVASMAERKDQIVSRAREFGVPTILIRTAEAVNTVMYEPVDYTAMPVSLPAFRSVARGRPGDHIASTLTFSEYALLPWDTE